MADIGFRPIATPQHGQGPIRSGGSEFRLFGDDGLTFRDLIDIVNPLHHVPILGAVYRKITGDVIDPAMRVAGGALFGGPLGAALAAIGAAIEYAASNPSTDPAKELPPNEMLAASSIPTPVAQRLLFQQRELPGGWLVNAARGNHPIGNPVPRDAMALAVVIHDRPAEGHAPRPRRGGWIVNAAYGLGGADWPDEREYPAVRVAV